MPQTFDQESLTSRSGINVTLKCEAFDCNKRAQKQITLEAGKYGPVSVNVCETCATEFEIEMTRLGKQLLSLSADTDKKCSDSNVYRVSTA